MPPFEVEGQLFVFSNNGPKAFFKPRVPRDVFMRDGNAFALMGVVISALRLSGQRDLIDIFAKEAKSSDYDNLLRTCLQYIELVDEDDVSVFDDDDD